MFEVITQYASRNTMTFSDMREEFTRNDIGSLDAVDTQPTGGAVYGEMCDGAFKWIRDTTFYRDTLIAETGSVF